MKNLKQFTDAKLRQFLIKYKERLIESVMGENAELTTKYREYVEALEKELIGRDPLTRHIKEIIKKAEEGSSELNRSGRYEVQKPKKINIKKKKR